jgi:hypothetical protein
VARLDDRAWANSERRPVGERRGSHSADADVSVAARNAGCADVRFVTLAQSAEPAQDRRRLEQAGIIGGRIDPRTWLVRKFAIDIDGNSNAWSNLFTRLLAGCCVIKVASPLGYRQWYYGSLRPWQHFVPVEADLSDLREKIDWCRMHDRQCAEIAAAGRDFAVRRTFETEMSAAVETLNERLGAGRHAGPQGLG